MIWLGIALVCLMLVLVAPFVLMSPESNSLTYKVVQAALDAERPWYLINPHQALLIATDRVMVYNRWSNTRSAHVRIEDGMAIVFNVSAKGQTLESRISLAAPNSLLKLGKIITDHMGENDHDFRT